MQSTVHHRPGGFDSSLDMVPRPQGGRRGGLAKFTYSKTPEQWAALRAKAAEYRAKRDALMTDEQKAERARQQEIERLDRERLNREFRASNPQEFTDQAPVTGMGGPRAKRRPSKYNLLVSSVVKDKFAGQPDALAKASAYIKEHNLFHGGHYVPGQTGKKSGGMKFSMPRTMPVAHDMRYRPKTGLVRVPVKAQRFF